MPRSHNSIQLLGYVGTQPEVRTVGGDRKVANFNIATSPPWNEERTEWHRCAAWGNLAGIIEQYVGKGDRVFIVGRLQYSEWTDDAGQDRKTAEVNVDQLVMLGSRGENVRATRSGVEEGVSDDELPF